MKKMVIAGLMVAGIIAMYGEDVKGNIKVKGEGFRKDKGEAFIVLHKEGDDFRKDTNIIKGVIKDGICEFDLKNIEYGEYAIKVVHDENKNGKMDMGIFGTEGIGVSKNVKLAGPPKYDEIKVVIDGSKKVMNIKMQYPTVMDFVAKGMKHGD